MNKVLRTFSLAAAVASSMVFGGSAGAAGGGAFVGTAHVDCFGCGTSDCDASLTVAGALVSTAPPGAAPVLGGAETGTETAPCTANEPADVTCVISGTASGKVEGVLNVDFNWTRVGATAVITTTGDIDGAGVAAFHVSSPTGNPCGQEVVADIAGALVGQ
jgi:hypothetical protein